MKQHTLSRVWKMGLFLVTVACLVTLSQVIEAQPEPSISTTSYTIVDTGQSTCYDNNSEISCPQPDADFYGQDAQFDGNQPSYTLSADGLTVYDNVTGLTWTQSPDLDGDDDIDVDDKLTFAEAQTYAGATLNPQSYGGYSDWRLPTMKELYSLMDFRGTDPSGPDVSSLTPFIDTAYFAFGYGDTDAGERNIDAQFWSSNTYVGNVFGDRTATFGLNLADGRIKGYPSDSTGPMVKLNYVYFVRGNTAYGVNDFSDNGDGTVTDNATGLMWSQNDSGDGVDTGPRSGMNWEDALSWVEQKNDDSYLGYNNWRLPNAKEMQSILDYSRAPDATSSAAIDSVFNITAITNEGGEVDYPWFWTSTTHLRANGSGAAGVYICFGRATGYMNSSWMDVHGAGSQRSDQKGGDFTGYTYVTDGYYFSQSPQGDATRIYNYVRLVRDAEEITHTLVVDVVGQGSVDLNPTGDVYSEGATVTLTATSDPGWQFAGWSGELDGTVSPITLTMDADKVVTATFSEIPPGPTYTLAVDTVGQGSVDLNPTGDVYSEGATVTMTATSDPGWQFAGWGGELNGTVSPVTLTMNADKVVTATFSEIPPGPTYTLAVEVGPSNSGTVNLNPPGEVYGYGENTVVELTANPAVGYEFVSWGGALSGSDNSATLTVTQNMTVTASFSQTVTDMPHTVYLPLVIGGERDTGSAVGEFNLFAPLRSTTTYLMDNDGNIVHTWASDYTLGNSVYLLENGNLLRTGNTKSKSFEAGGAGGIVQEIGPDGTAVWEFEYDSDQVRLHHDVESLPNGNVLMIAWERKTEAEAIAAGRAPSLLNDSELWPDHIIEVSPSSGAIVWEWHVWDHLIQDHDPTKENYGVVADHPELIDLNFSTGGPPGDADWNHTNSIDYDESLDQILLSVRNFGEIWVIDHSTTSAEAAGHVGGDRGKGGDLLYRWGNPQAYDAGSTADQQLFVQHDAQWIPTGYPGEGNILVFNNGTGRPGGNYSSVDEIVPPVDGSGNYTSYGPAAPVWTYVADNPTDFYAERISGAQRLDNGNTLICDGPNGDFIEVTPENEIVWTYDYTSQVFRVTRYVSSYPGLSAIVE